MMRAVGCPYFRRAFGWCVPIGGLGGLIGLGGGEFRLPVLIYGIGFGRCPAESANEPCYPDLRAGNPQRRGVPRGRGPLSARNGGPAGWWHGERLLWRAAGQPAEQ